MSANYHGIMVFCESDEDLKLKKVSLELLSKAVELSEITGEKVICVSLVCSEDLSSLAKYGAREIVAVKRERKNFFDLEGDADAGSQVIEKYKPSKVFFGATDIGRVLAPKIAARLHCGITADCTEFSINKSGKLVQIRPALGGNILAHIVSPETFPQMATVRPSVFKTMENEVPCELVEFIPENIESSGVIEITREKLETAGETKIEDALKVIAIGIGLRKKVLPKVIKLADMMGAAVACSRKVVEAGWLSPSVQVGQSGKTISPDLYIALGISGASQHLAGMKTSSEIIAVNNDPDADIFSVAHIGFVMDVEKWLDAMIFKLEKEQ